MVCPLSSIIQDQIDVLKTRGIAAGTLKLKDHYSTCKLFLGDKHTEEVDCFCHLEDLLSEDRRSLIKTDNFR